MRIPLFSITVVSMGLVAVSPGLQGKDKKQPSGDPQDVIEVVGHIPPASGSVTRFLPTQHYSSYYLYVEHEGAKDVTLLDVSKTSQPLVLASIPSSPNGSSASLFAVAGTAAITTEQTANTQATVPQTIRIMNFSDPKQPKVAREFTGVTALSRDDRRGLIFLANPEGIWILHQRLAEDPELEREYERRILYDH